MKEAYRIASKEGRRETSRKEPSTQHRIMPATGARRKNMGLYYYRRVDCTTAIYVVYISSLAKFLLACHSISCAEERRLVMKDHSRNDGIKHLEVTPLHRYSYNSHIQPLPPPLSPSTSSPFHLLAYCIFFFSFFFFCM